VRIRDIAVRATTYEKPPALLRARVAELDPRDRLRRAARAFFPVFGVGCALLFIPPHLLSFTVCAAIATTRAIRRQRETRLIEALEGPCPGCAVEQRYDPPARLPHILRCPRCGSFLTVEPG
jgi:hypothetical protein